MAEDCGDRTEPHTYTHAYEPATWEAAFLTAFRITGNVVDACEAVPVGRRTVYDRRKAHPEFATLWEEAEAEAADRLEKEARRRAEQGTEKYVINKGNLVWVWVDEHGNVTDEENGALRVPLKEREYSDGLMTLLLKAHKPEKYKDRVANEITGKDGAAVQVNTKASITFNDLKDMELGTLAKHVSDAATKGA